MDHPVDPKKKRVEFNPDNSFSGVAPAAWEYQIGGYQVADKWLKDRKGRVLSSEEVATYTKIITAISETIKIQESLDELYTKVEENLLDLKL